MNNYPSILDLIEPLYENGWQAGAPNQEAIKEGKTASNKAICFNCQFEGLDYYPVNKGFQYRAFLECPSCKIAVSF